MTVIFWENAEAEQNFNSDIWVDVASKTGFLRAVPHWLWIYCEYGGTLTNREVEIRVLVNGAERGYDYHTPSKTNGYKQFSTFGQLNPAVEDESYTVTLQIRGENAAQTVNVRRIRLMVMQE